MSVFFAIIKPPLCLHDTTPPPFINHAAGCFFIVVWCPGHLTYALLRSKKGDVYLSMPFHHNMANMIVSHLWIKMIPIIIR